ncbi:MAG: GH3 auxin-responsive promoter family protein, partial [Bacteroidales bacterium]|nr:GH3 auxin-responsive promoter family protein [Bacteroidales bacterium]
MPIVSKIYRLYSSKRLKLLDQNRKDPISFQRVAFENFLTKGEQTIFGAEHNIHEGMSLQEFQESVPLRDYNKIESWITRSRAGEENL